MSVQSAQKVQDVPKNTVVWVYISTFRFKAMLVDDGKMHPQWQYVGGVYDKQLCPWPEYWEPIEDEN